MRRAGDVGFSQVFREHDGEICNGCNCTFPFSRYLSRTVGSTGFFFFFSLTCGITYRHPLNIFIANLDGKKWSG